VQPLQDTQTQRFMLGEGVSIAQNQPTTAVRRAPFSGKIRPGDILNIEIAGGFPEPIEPRRTVEPDGNVAIGAAYGDKGRIQVAGKSLIEAGEHIEKELRAILKDPNVIVTYAGHDPDIVAEGEVAATTATSFPAAEPIVLAPLDTIDLHLPVKGLMLRTSVDGKLREVHTTPQSIDDVYIIEPDGNIALPFRYGRVNIKGMTEGDAGNAIRNHLTEQWMPRTGLPQVSVRKRGHAVFPADQPSADGRIRPGDSLLIGNQLQSSAFNYQVTSEGNLPGKAIVLLPDGQSTVPPLHVAGLSLAEAQDAIAKSRKDAIIVTIGGWHEEADPDVVAEGEADKTLNILAPPAAEPVVLAPLDTIEVRLGAKSDNLASVNGTYVIEPDGLIGLFNGRLKLAGLTELEAGNAIRTHFSQSQWQRKAPPSINVVRRGRAVFPAGKQPAADYRVRAGGLLLVNQNFSAADGTNYEVSADGMLQSQPDFIGQPYEPVHVAGLTLDEVQKRLCENWKARQKSGGEIWSDPQEQAWVVTIGGWHEEADPALIDRLGESADPRVQQLERELQQIKTMIHAQQR
jgi:protein involved in polysaccharide export with SLBB domain